MNERAGLAFAAQAALQLGMRRAIDLAGSTSRNGGLASEDPVVRDQLAQLFIESEIFRVTNYRGPDQDHEERRARARRARSASGSGPRSTST